MIRLSLAAFLSLSITPGFAVSPDPKSLAIPASETLRAKELIRRLGSESYAEREQAQRTLMSMGRRAKAALAEAVQATSDPEVLRRVNGVMPHAVDEDMKARVDVFLADVEGKYEHDFPGLSAYCEIVGSDAAARSLFAEMVKSRANASLLGVLEGPTEELARRFSERRQAVWNQKYPRTPDTPPREPELADVVSLLLVDTLAMPTGGGASVGSMFASTGFLPNGLPGTRGEVVKKLLNRWIVTRDDTNFLYTALTIANRFELPGAAACASKLLTTAKTSSYARATAIATMGRVGSREQLPALEKCFDDETVSTRARVPGANPNEFQEIRVQDSALAAALMVTKQKPEDYGFKEWTLQGTPASRSRYLPYYLPAGSRSKAFEKWANWRKANPDMKARKE